MDVRDAWREAEGFAFIMLELEFFIVELQFGYVSLSLSVVFICLFL